MDLVIKSVMSWRNSHWSEQYWFWYAPIRNGIGRSSELLLNNVQGEFEVGVAKTIQFINSVGVTTTLNYAGGSALGPLVPFSNGDYNNH